MLENKLGREFDSLTQRMIWGCLACYPDFVPVRDCAADEQAQKQMHEFLRRCLERIYGDFSLIGCDDVPDGCFLRWEIHKRSNPELDAQMNALRRRYDALMSCLIKIGCAGEIAGDRILVPRPGVCFSDKILQKLDLLGIAVEVTGENYAVRVPDYPDLLPAWKAHCAEIPKGKAKEADVDRFVYGQFGGKTYTVGQHYGAVTEHAIVAELERYFAANGYTVLNDSSSVRYNKPIQGEKQLEMKCTFDWRKKRQLHFRLNIPFFKWVLEAFGELEQQDPELADTLFHSVPLCVEECYSCVKGTTARQRRKDNLPVTHGEETDVKCPYFPCLVWYEPDGRMLREVTHLLDFAEKLYRRHGVLFAADSNQRTEEGV